MTGQYETEGIIVDTSRRAGLELTGLGWRVA